MKAKLIKIQNKKRTRNGIGEEYMRLHFHLEDGTYAMTDVVPGFRNYAWWDPVIKAGWGVWVTNVFLKDGYKDKINADSQVEITQAPLVNQEALL